MKKVYPLIAGLTAFAITGIAMLTLMGGQLFYIYSDEILGKGLHISITSWLFLCFALSVSGTILPICILSMGLFAGRVYFRSKEPMPAFRQNFMTLLTIMSLGGFYFNGFTVPGFNREALQMLYNIRNAHSELEYYRSMVDSKYSMISIMNSSPEMCNVPMLYKNVEKLKHTMDNASKTENKEILRLRDYQAKIDDENLLGFRKVFVKALFYPFMLFIFGLNGLLLGYLFRKPKLFVPIVVFYFLIAVIPVVIARGLDMIVSKRMIGPFIGQVVYLTIFAIPALLFLSVEKKWRLRQEVTD